MQKFLIVISFVSIFLSACSQPALKDHDSNLYSVPVGSTLRLNKAITIPANQARRYFQYGRPIKEKDIDLYYPHCSLVMNTLAMDERTIQPAMFEIYQVIDDNQEVRRYIEYASNYLASDSGPVIVGFTSFYYLRSTENPDIISLECLQWNDPYNNDYLTINEVKKVLGDYFTLMIKE